MRYENGKWPILAVYGARQNPSRKRSFLRTTCLVLSDPLFPNCRGPDLGKDQDD